MENIFTQWESVINFTRNDIVFERQNKEYGAYAIRKYYPERLRNAFIYSVSGMVLLLAVPLMLQKWNPVIPKIKVPPPIIEFTDYFPPVKTEFPPTLPTNPPGKQKSHETANLVVIDSTIANKVEDANENAKDNNKAADNTDDKGASNLDNNGIKGTTNTATPEPDFVPYAQVMPEFIGGDKMLDKFLTEHIQYPSRAREEGISGRISVMFVIDKNGKVKNATIRRGGLGGGLEEEALRVIRLMPDWKPGMTGGHPVAVQLTIPINFVLKEN